MEKEGACIEGRHWKHMKEAAREISDGVGRTYSPCVGFPGRMSHIVCRSAAFP